MRPSYTLAPATQYAIIVMCLVATVTLMLGALLIAKVLVS